MTVEWEWTIEEMDGSEVIDVDHAKSYADAMATVLASGGTHEIGLTCDEFPADGGRDRSWAYVVNGKLPAHTSDATGEESRKVPQRFIREVEKYHAVN